MTIMRLSCTFCLIASLLLGGCAPRRAPEVQRPEAIDYYVRGEEARRAGDPKRAEEQFKQAVQRNPSLRMAHWRLGDMYKDRGDYRNATRHYETVVRLDPYSYLAHYNLGLVYHFLNRFQEAAASYLRALNLQPSDLNSNMNLGLVYVTLGEYDEAVNYLTRATEIDPKSSAAWSNLGVALDAGGDTAQAEVRYRRALELNPESTTILQNLASNLITQGKASEAIAVMDEVVARVDTAATRKRYGDALAQARRYDEALLQYDLALKRDPRFFPAMNEKGFVYILQYRDGLELDDSKREAAIAQWRESLKLNPNQPGIREQLDKAENPSLFGRRP